MVLNCKVNFKYQDSGFLQRGLMITKDSSKTTLKADKRLITLDNSLKAHQYQKDSLLEILHTAQESYGFLDNDILMYISKSLRLPPSHVLGVATFYNFFKFKKPGSHVVTFCLGTACYVRGVEEIIEAVEKEFNVKRGETTADGKLSVFITRCIGACAMAPNAVVDEEVVGKATRGSVINKIKSVIKSENN
jgi:bidirectional [NiFe] hydrogenase diaphorase subunit